MRCDDSSCLSVSWPKIRMSLCESAKYAVLCIWRSPAIIESPLVWRLFGGFSIQCSLNRWELSTWRQRPIWPRRYILIIWNSLWHEAVFQSWLDFHRIFFVVTTLQQGDSDSTKTMPSLYCKTSVIFQSLIQVWTKFRWASTLIQTKILLHVPINPGNSIVLPHVPQLRS